MTWNRTGIEQWTFQRYTSTLQTALCDRQKL